MDDGSMPDDDRGRERFLGPRVTQTPQRPGGLSALSASARGWPRVGPGLESPVGLNTAISRTTGEMGPAAR